jgi:hypothetical protein
MRPLGAEEELGRALIKALDEEQRKDRDHSARAPKDIFNMPGRSDTKPEGITSTTSSRQSSARCSCA